VCVLQRRAMNVLDGISASERQVKTAAQYSCDVWHYVAVTIDGRDGTLYVDGIGAGHTLPSSRDLYTFSVETFNTTTRPDFGADSTGVLKLGCEVPCRCLGVFAANGILNQGLASIGARTHANKTPIAQANRPWANSGGALEVEDDK
jgi:hypothetical protein